MKHLQWKNLLLVAYVFNVQIFFENGDTEVFKADRSKLFAIVRRTKFLAGRKRAYCWYPATWRKLINNCRYGNRYII